MYEDLLKNKFKLSKFFKNNIKFKKKSRNFKKIL